ncbi:MAG: kanamycin nucleotidyltransferase C-terminal domain-containing protein [Ktedonobacterales bacterium]
MTDTTDENAIRVEIAREVVKRKQQALGAHLLAAACYGSVAHAAASRYSDVELILLTDDETPAVEEQFFARGIMVECDRLPLTRILAAARRVDPQWGIEADQHLHHLILWDPSGAFAQVQTAAKSVPGEAFASALTPVWWAAWEARGKFRNAALQGDVASMYYSGWLFARNVALRIALHERRPYESLRTIWQDVAARGYGMRELIAALTGGSAEGLSSAGEFACEQTCAWGQPPDAPER